MKNDDKYLKSLYTTLFSQKFSNSGNELAVCSNFGDVAIYNLVSVLNVENEEKIKLPCFLFKAHKGCLYSLESISDYLVCGAINEIVAFKWNDLNTKNDKTFWSIKLPIDSNELNSAIEINSIICDSKNDPKHLYAACGNGEIYNFDLECNKLIRNYSAHKECIYQIIIANNSNELISASEDGYVKIWDTRAHNCQITIKPYEHEMCARPQYGRYINCVAIDDDNWMVCGGGPKLSMWHLRSLRPMSVQDPDPTYIPNTCALYENQILTGGNMNHLFSYSYDNKLKRDIVTNTNCIYDISINYVSKYNKIMCVAGTGCIIDLCINFAYKSLCLNFE